MNPTLKYYLGGLLCLPLLPLMYIQAKGIRKRIPSLPEATGNVGITQINDDKLPLNILILGESTMAGIGVPTHQLGFAGAMAEAFSYQIKRQINWKVFAKSGYTAKDVNQQILPNITNEKPDLILIGLGGNDTFVLNSPRTWSIQIEQMIQQLQASFGQVPIVFINMPPIADFPAFTPLIKMVLGNLVLLHRQALMQLLSSKKNVYFADEVITLENWITKKKQTKAEDFFSDGIHPNQLTYQTWGEDIATFIVKETGLRF